MDASDSGAVGREYLCTNKGCHSGTVVWRSIVGVREDADRRAWLGTQDACVGHRDIHQKDEKKSLSIVYFEYFDPSN